MAKQDTVKQKVDKVKKEIGAESISDIFNLKNNQTFSQEKAPENLNGVDIWGKTKKK